MCDSVQVIGGPYIYSPEEFKEHFGYEPMPHGANKSAMEYPCMCGANLDATFREHGVPYIFDGVGYTVGTSDQLSPHMDKFVVRSFGVLAQ